MTKSIQGPVTRTASTFNVMYAGQVSGIDTLLPLATDEYQIYEVFMQADPDNPADVLMGTALVQYVVLEAGDTLTLPIDSLTKVYIRFPTAGPNYVNWIAMG